MELVFAATATTGFCFCLVYVISCLAVDRMLFETAFDAMARRTQKNIKTMKNTKNNKKQTRKNWIDCCSKPIINQILNPMFYNKILIPQNGNPPTKIEHQTLQKPYTSICKP